MKKRFFTRPDVCIGLIALSTLVAYIPAYRAGYIWDDDRYVTRNPTLQSVDGLRRIWFETGATPQYYPLAFTTFWLESQTWGFSPVGFHVVNVLLHVGCAILLWRILLLLAVPGALFAALLFALHPLHVESVAWITERKNVLSGVFYLGAMWAYLRWARIGDPAAAGKGVRKYYAAAIVLFFCALLSKSVTATLPAAVLLILWWKRGRIGLRDVAATVPFFLAAVAMSLITVTIEREHVGTEKLDWGLSALDRFLVAGRAACFYLGKLVWPADLTFIYPRWTIDATQAIQFLYPLGVFAAIVILYGLRRRIGRGPLTAALFYLGTILPALGFVMVYPMRFSFVADHFCYLAGIGPIAIVSAALAKRFRRSTVPPSDLDGAAPVSPAAPILATILLGLLGLLTWRQCGMYKDVETLWRDTLAKNPDAWVARNNLGLILLNSSQFEEATEHFIAATRLFPEFPEAHNNLGNALAALGRLDDAEAQLQEALRLVPYYANARFNLGRLRERQGRLDEALADYRTVIGLNVYYVPAHLCLVDLLVRQGKPLEAMDELDRAIQSFKELPDASLLYKAKAAIFLSNGKPEEAIAALKEAVRIAPSLPDLRLRLANALFQSGRLDDAAMAYVETLAINPENAQAHYNLGVIRVSQGNPQEGHEHFTEAVRLAPDYTVARFALAQLLEAAHRPDDAVREYQEILRRVPNDPDARQRLELLSRQEPGTSTTSAPSGPSTPATDQ